MRRLASAQEKLHHGSDYLTVYFELDIVGILGEVEYVLFWLRFWDNTEFSSLDEFDHIGAIYEAIVVWIA